MTTRTGRFVRRFDAVDRALHVFLMIAFLGLALTGLPLVFHDADWARSLVRVFGSFETAGVVHRACATLLIAVFAVHLWRVGRRIVTDKDWGMLWGPRSMVPQPRDVTDFVGHVKWFVGQGPRPAFDRFTYWEKFDYWAVFWGMGVIGASGLMLWFPAFFSRFLPGWAFNVALLVHGEEALLAVGFIFTLHFFNGHLRPEKFPMDPVIFTGVVPEEEMQRERPGEYARLQATGALDAIRTTAPPPWLRVLGYAIGTTAIVTGLTMVGLIVIGLMR